MPTSITCSVVSMPSHSFSFPCETFPPPSVVQGNTLPLVSPVSFPHPAFFPHLIFPKLEPDGPPPFLVRIPAHLPPRSSSMGTISLPSLGAVSFPSMWVVSSSAHYQVFLVGVGGGGGLSCQGHSTCSWTPYPLSCDLDLLLIRLPWLSRC